MATVATTTEADILQQVVAPAQANLPPDVAQALLRFKFSPSATRTIRQLLRQHNRGTIIAEDRVLLEKYLRVGQMLDLIHAKAQLSLQKPRKNH